MSFIYMDETDTGCYTCMCTIPVCIYTGAYEPLKAEKERLTTHHSTERHLNLNHLTHLPKKERDVYLARKLQR